MNYGQKPENKRTRVGAVSTRGTDLLIMNNYTRLNFALEYVVNADSTSIAFEDNVLGANECTAYNIRVSDEHGNEAVGLLAPASPSTTVNVDTSGLVVSDCWIIGVHLTNGRGGDIPQSTQTSQLELEGVKNDLTGTIDENNGVGTLNIQVYGTKNGASAFPRATVADAGTAAIGACAIGDEVVAYVYLQNTSTEFPLSVYTITYGNTGFISGGGSTPFTPLAIAPEEENGLIKVVMNTATALIKTATVTVTNNTTNVSYIITITTVPA